MLDVKQTVNDLMQQIMGCIPANLAEIPQGLEQNIRHKLQDTLASMDLVTREEFDIQTKVLARTRLKLEQLEQRLEEWQQCRDG